MPSFNNPSVTNSIFSDVSEIRELLKIVAKQDYTEATDLPVGTKRIVGITGGAQLQQYADDTWSSIGKLMHDVDQLDGYHASLTAVKKTIPVYNDNSQLVGDITGNAASASKLQTKRTIDIGGIASADAVEFDGSANITIPINSINVSEDSLTGIVPIEHGGTGRTDGAATDVILSNGGRASEYGQIGDAVMKSATTDLNTLVTTGIYHCTVTNGLNYNHPLNTSSGGALVRVYNRAPYVFQVWKSLVYGIEFTRYSENSGSSWKQWHPGGGSFGSSMYIYISKSGSDTNTGYDSEHPVASISRALELSKGARPSQTITFRIGEGNWGSLTLSNLPMTLYIEDYSGDTSGVYSSSFPVFDSIVSRNSYTVVRNVHCYRIVSEANGYMSIERYIRTGCLQALNAGYMAVNTTKLDIVNRDNNSFVFSSDYNGCLIVSTSVGVDIIENISVVSSFLSISHNSKIMINKENPFTLSDGVTVTGRKYNLYRTSELWLYDDDTLNEIPGTTEGILAVGARVNGIPYGGGDSDAALMADRTWKPVLLQTGGTLTGELSLRGNNLDYNSYTTNIDVTETPSKTTGVYFRVYDKNSQLLSAIGGGKNASGRQYAELAAYWGHGDSLSTKSITIQVEADGTTYTMCPEPAENSNSTAIATTSWVRKTLYKGATASANATSGLVPAATKGEQDKVLRGDGTWGDYLPTTDGVVNGRINFNLYGTDDYIGTIVAVNDRNGKRLLLDTNEEGDQGAFLELRKGSDTKAPGGFQLAARNANGSAIKPLVGHIDGSLMWDGKQIVRSVNGIAAGLDGNVDILSKVTGKVARAKYTQSVDSGAYNGTGYINAPDYGSTWFCIGHAVFQGSRGSGNVQQKEWNSCGYYSAGAQIFAKTINMGISGSNFAWVRVDIVCIPVD